MASKKMNIKQAQIDLNKAKAKLETIRADIAEKKAKLDAAEESHTKHVAANAGRKRFPRSLQVQRESLLRLKLEIEVLEKAKTMAEDEVAAAERSLHLAEGGRRYS